MLERVYITRHASFAAVLWRDTGKSPPRGALPFAYGPPPPLWHQGDARTPQKEMQRLSCNREKELSPARAH